MKLKILIVDDNEFYRQGFKLTLERFNIVDEVIESSSGSEFLTQLPKLVPDLVFMDIKMPDMDGIEATRLATQDYRGTKIIALTMFGDDKYLHKMIQAGAKGYLLKDSNLDEIELAISTVMQSKHYFSNRVVNSTKIQS